MGESLPSHCPGALVGRTVCLQGVCADRMLPQGHLSPLSSLSLLASLRVPGHRPCFPLPPEPQLTPSAPQHTLLLCVPSGPDRRQGARFGVGKSWSWPAPTCRNCVASGKILTLSEPQLLICEMGVIAELLGVLRCGVDDG